MVCIRISFFYMFIFTLYAGIQASPLIEVREFLKNDAIYVKDVEDDRIYLRNEYLALSAEGMYIIDPFNQKIPLSELFSDTQGLYTKIASFGNNLATVYPIVWCRTCNAWRTINIKGLCAKCGTPP